MWQSKSAAVILLIFIIAIIPPKQSLTQPDTAKSGNVVDSISNAISQLDRRVIAVNAKLDVLEMISAKNEHGVKEINSLIAKIKTKLNRQPQKKIIVKTVTDTVFVPVPIPHPEVKADSTPVIKKPTFWQKLFKRKSS